MAAFCLQLVNNGLLSHHNWDSSCYTALSLKIIGKKIHIVENGVDDVRSNSARKFETFGACELKISGKKV